MIKRTPEIKKSMEHAIQQAIDLLEHPSMPHLVSSAYSPKEIASFLVLDKKLLTRSGVLREKSAIMNDLQCAADYLNHREITYLPSLIAAGNLRDIISDLK